jgi:hypothetical protein
MDRLCTPQPSFHPLVTVIGVRGAPYPCPDIATLDAHIAWLSHRIERAPPRFGTLVAEFRAEIDLLLDRRRWLELEQQFTLEVAA